MDELHALTEKPGLPGATLLDGGRTLTAHNVHIPGTEPNAPADGTTPPFYEPQLRVKRLKVTWLTDASVTPHKRRFRDYQTDAVTSKMWILPDGRIAPSSVWHYRWLLGNRALAQELGVPLNKLPEEEEPIRLAALRAGFVRLNYVHKTGTLTVEANRLRFGGNAKNAVQGVVIENLNDVYIFRFNLLSVPQRGRPFLWRSESIALFKRLATERPSLVAHIIDPQALS